MAWCRPSADALGEKAALAVPGLLGDLPVSLRLEPAGLTAGTGRPTSRQALRAPGPSALQPPICQCLVLHPCSVETDACWEFPCPCPLPLRLPARSAGQAPTMVLGVWSALLPPPVKSRICSLLTLHLRLPEPVEGRWCAQLLSCPSGRTPPPALALAP